LRCQQTKLLYPDHRLSFVWPGCSGILSLARPRRIKGVTLIRLPDYRPLPLPVAIALAHRLRRFDETNMARLGYVWTPARCATVVPSVARDEVQRTEQNDL